MKQEFAALRESGAREGKQVVRVPKPVDSTNEINVSEIWPRQSERRTGAEKLFTELAQLVPDAAADPDVNTESLIQLVNSIKPAEVAVPGRIPVTETSNAERLFRKHGQNLRYCSERGAWCVWDARSWAVNDEGAVMRLMQEVARSIYQEAASEPDEHLRKSLGTWAKQSESRRIQENSVAIARFFEGIEVRKFSEVFDTHSLLLNVPNGTVDLESGKLHPHRREDLLTKVVNIEYDPRATCPGFAQFLLETFADNFKLIRYAQRLAGYFLTASTGEQKWWMFYGPTASGKSTFVQVLQGLLGPYALALPENYFLVSKNSSDFITASLAGVRLATCVETNEGRRLDVAKIKTLTGEDAISAAFKFEDYFTFKPQCKLVLVTNYAPHVPASDDALWRRLKVLPFNVTVPAEKRMPGLAEKLLTAEGPGILRWAVLGNQAWQAGGLEEPEEVTSAVSAYRAAEDVVEHFLTECCVRQPTASVARKEVYAAYMQWVKEVGQQPMSKDRFGKELSRLGIGKDAGNRYWCGIRLEQTGVSAHL